MRRLVLPMCSLLFASVSVAASEPVVFVSAFKPGDEGAIHAFRFDTQTGTLKPLGRTTGIGQPFFMAISPNGQFLYAIDTDQFGGDEDEFVAAYAIAGDTAELTRLNRQSARGIASCYLDVDASGKSVVVANYSSGSVASLPVRENGSLGEAADFIQHEGSIVDPKRQTGPHAHSLVISPDNRFALAADLGLDQVRIYRFDAATSKLVESDVQPFASLPPGSGPRHLTFDPSGKRVYVINELANTVTFFDYAADSGTLTLQQTVPTLPEGFSGTSNCADLKITPDGQFLYATNRGHDSIAIYRIGTDGHLTLVGIEPSLGGGPQNLLITPDGRWLLCANMTGNNVMVFRIDSKSGGLTASGDPTSIPMPACVRWLPSK